MGILLGIKLFSFTHLLFIGLLVLILGVIFLLKHHVDNAFQKFHIPRIVFASMYIIMLAIFLTVIILQDDTFALISYNIINFFFLTLALLFRKEFLSKMAFLSQFTVIFSVVIPNSYMLNDQTTFVISNTFALTSFLFSNCLLFSDKFNVRTKDAMFIVLIVYTFVLILYPVNAINSINLLSLNSPRSEITLIHKVYEFDKVLYTLLYCYILNLLGRLMIPIYKFLSSDIINFD